MALDLTHTASIFKTDILSAVKNVTRKDLPAAAGFAQSQLQSLAQQSALVAGMIEANAFTAAEQIFYLDGLEQMAKGLAQTVIQVIEIEIEKLINAVVSAIYDAINSVAGVALVAPRVAA
ncbi:hypothetical protein IAG25_31210 [Caballeronia sp. EK]|uniref:hypothetical protein n=1 Tax=Caballeronia sp. EK TaxID=2767469 RepID=UPI00165653E4|nr:hypothetical protein [Caballeronia sp. EK]MBC8641292.1 hypothetical protein [Caballeronia sp. EK]